MLYGPVFYLIWFSQYSANLAYGMTYLLAFYVPAIVTKFFNKEVMFSTKTMKGGVLSVSYVAIAHLVVFSLTD
jgi:hypothetical protein